MTLRAFILNAYNACVMLQVVLPALAPAALPHPPSPLPANPRTAPLRTVHHRQRVSRVIDKRMPHAD